MATAAATVDSRPVSDVLEALRPQVFAYCYRMLGSPHDAEDAVQEAMLRAWRSIEQLEDPAGLKAWVYRIATNVCIDASSRRRRRALPMDLGPADDGHGRFSAPRPESSWVQPVASARLAEDPLEQALNRDSVRLAFLAALQHLAPRQRAVLILRDVLRWRAAEVATLLDSSVDAVNSALRRARKTLAAAHAGGGSSARSERVDRALLERYIDAFERYDVDRIVALLHDDAVISMPPHAFWLRGAAAFETWLRARDPACGHESATLTNANGVDAVLFQDRADDGSLVPAALHVIEWEGDQVVELHAFLDPSAIAAFVAA